MVRQSDQGRQATAGTPNVPHRLLIIEQQGERRGEHPYRRRFGGQERLQVGDKTRRLLFIVGDDQERCALFLEKP